MDRLQPPNFGFGGNFFVYESYYLCYWQPANPLLVFHFGTTPIPGPI